MESRESWQSWDTIRIGMEQGTPGQGEATDYKPFSVLCQVEPPPSLLPPVHQSRITTTNCLFVSYIESFSVMRMTCFQIKMVKQVVFCWWNKVVNIMETIIHRVIPRHSQARLCNVVVMRRPGLGRDVGDLRRKYKLVIDYQLQTTQLIMRASPPKILHRTLYLRSDTNQDVYYRFISVS